MESMWSLHGVPVESLWSLHGLHRLHEDSMRTLRNL
jgi:hypothetical protein